MNFYPIFLEDFIKFKRLCLRSFFIASLLLNPFLYIFTFGWGLSGKGVVEGISYMEFLIPGIIAFSSMNNSFNWTALSIEIGRTTFKTFEQYIISPISSIDIMIGKVMAGSFRGIISAMVIILIAYLFGIKIKLNGLFFFALLLNCILFSCLGVICGMTARVHGDVSTFSNFFLTPMGLFCGTFFPIDTLPKPIVKIIYFLPLTHSVSSLRDAFLGNPVSLISLMYLVILCSISFIVGIFYISKARE